jgi:hypothetical protein
MKAGVFEYPALLNLCAWINERELSGIGGAETSAGQ